ncbi:MAG: hypothetical protein ACTS2F_07470 [Thainema sp.]
MTEPNNEMELVNETTIDLEPTTLEVTPTLEGDALESNEFEASQEALQTKRIQEIVKKALTQAFAEAKQSAGEFRTITKETLTEVAATMQAEDPSTQHSADQTSSAPSSSSSVKSILAAVFKALKSEFSTFAQRQSVELKQQTSNWDAKLEQQYGDRYTSRKQQAKDAAAWYTKTANQAQTIKPSPFERKQAEMGETFGESGTRFAQKEQQIKQQIKQRLQTLAAKF